MPSVSIPPDVANAAPGEIAGTRLRHKLERRILRARLRIQAALAGRNVVRNMRAAQRLLVGFIRAVERGVQKGKIDSTLAIRVLAGAEGMLGQVRASLGVGQGPP